MITFEPAAPTTSSIIPNDSLRAATPQDGIHLATQMARALCHSLNESEGKPAAEMADYLRQSASPAIPAPLSHLVVSSFAIIAAANDYWR